MAIQDLSKVDPGNIYGALVLIPMANVLAYRAGTPSIPQDGMDVCCIWPERSFDRPGRGDGHSARTINRLIELMGSVADAVVDCHSGGWPHQMSPHTRITVSENGELSARCRAMAHSTGLPLIWETQAQSFQQDLPVTLADILHYKRLPSVTIEVGGQGRVSSEDLNTMKDAVHGLARQLGVLAGPPSQVGRPYVLRKTHRIQAERGGLLMPVVKLMEQVQSNQPIAVVKNLYGSLVEEIVSPRSGIVVGHRTMGTVNTGQHVAVVGELEP
jgi:predicted deacylase